MIVPPVAVLGTLAGFVFSRFKFRYKNAIFLSWMLLRAVPGVLIVQHRLGFISANAGVDRSNVAGPGTNIVLRLPSDPDRSARRLRQRLQPRGALPPQPWPPSPEGL